MPSRQLVRQHLFDRIHIGVIEHGALSQFALAAGRLRRQDMAGKRVTALDLASPRLLEALGGALVGL